jgi:membrane associated rhomboid family serine protease
MDAAPVRLASRVAMLVAFLFAVAVVVALDRPGGSWGARLRRRFVMGVPWGTLVVVGFVLSVYLFVQGAWGHWYAPVVLPFRAWSYLYPLGMLTAGFSHVGVGHLLGNLAGTLALAPLVEYAWGHFPRERGSSSFGSPRTNPLVRAFVLFPLCVLAVGLFTSLSAVGPVIGFSGVVFAFAGFALVQYPLRTVVALVGSEGVRLLYTALRNPVTVSEARPSYGGPWWAQVAIQAHAVGLLVGVLLGVWLLRRRGGDGPSGLRLWTAGALLAVSQGLWAVYWFRGGGSYVLYRGAGVALAALLATLVAVAGAASDRPLSGRVGAAASSVRGLPRWQVGAVLLLVGTAALAGPAVPVNLLTASDEPAPGEGVDVRGYEVTYAEDVTSGMVSVVDVELLGETTRVNTSGVIVRNPDRHVWTTAVPAGRLGFYGRESVLVGGVGWRERVDVERRGWTPVGNSSVYRVRLRHDGESVVAHRAPPSTAEPVVDGRNVTVAADGDRFVLRVSRGGERLGVAPVPSSNETVAAGGLRLTRTGRAVFAVAGDTRVRVAAREQYPGRER